MIPARTVTVVHVVRRTLGALSVAAMLTACANDDATSASELVGRSFVSVDVVGRAIPGGGPLELTFPARERMVAFAGCNRFTGPADLSGGTVRTGRQSSTRVACPPPRSDADAWLTTLFSAAPRWHLDGENLTLTGDGVTVTLRERSARN